MSALLSIFTASRQQQWLVSRCNEDCKDTPGYFDETRACRMSLLIFVAKVLFSGFWTPRSSSSTRFALRLQQWRVLSLLGRGTVRPHDLIVVEKLGMAIADGVQFVSARNGFEI